MSSFSKQKPKKKRLWATVRKHGIWPKLERKRQKGLIVCKWKVMSLWIWWWCWLLMIFFFLFFFFILIFFLFLGLEARQLWICLKLKNESACRCDGLFYTHLKIKLQAYALYLSPNMYLLWYTLMDSRQVGPTSSKKGLTI